MPLRRRGSMGNLSSGSPLCPVVNVGRGAGQVRMASQDQYQQRASECLRLAEQSVDEKESNAWRELALCWLRLSEYAEQFRQEAKSRAA